MKVTVLGGRGLLGARVTHLLRDAGHQVVAASRSAQVPVDLVSGSGLAEIMAEADTVVHLASDARRPKKVDVEGTRKVLSHMKPDQHIVYMSIVGVDRHPFGYYQAKFQAEQMIEGAGHSHSIVRATQFHDFVALFIGAACRPKVALIPKEFVFQPIDTGEVASRVAEVVETREPGLLPDLAGPEIHTTEYLARTLMAAQGRKKSMLNLPAFGKAARAFKAGLHTNPERAVGVRTWAEYLAGFPPHRG